MTNIGKWGHVNGKEASLYRLGDAQSVQIVMSDFGATLVSCLVPDQRGGQIDVILSCPDPQHVVDSGTYFGATVGRYGNRIKEGKFDLFGEQCMLARNEGNNHLHGGVVGYDKRFWDVIEQTDRSLTFSLHSPDRDEGYRGSLTATARYEISGNALRYTLTAVVDRPSPVNLLNHAYWNLAGSGDVLDHEYQFSAAYYTPADDELMLTGEIVSVSGTPFDFREPRTARERFFDIDNKGAGRVSGNAGGYDHNLVLDRFDGRLRKIGRIVEPKSKRAVTIATTEPGLHFYTGGYLRGVVGRHGEPYPAFAGFTLETQKFPDSPNFGHFPSATITPGQEYRHSTELTFEF